MCLLISDQDGANGDWAILGGMSNANFDSFLDLGGTDGVSNLAPIEMVPIPAPSVSNISAIPSGFGFSASVVLSGGNFVQGDCECLTGGGFRIVAASVPLGSQPPQSRDSANWTHPVTLAGGAAQSSPSAFGSTVDFEIGCLAGNQQVYVAAELAFDSGFRAVHVSADAVGPGLQPLNCPPCPIDTDMDGFCDPGDNCPQDYNPHQSDFDLDGEGDLCDLNDGLIYIVGSSPIRIEWQEEGFTRWNSYRGDMEYLRNTGIYTQDLGLVPLARRECRLMDPWLDDTDLLPVGKVVFYLTTGVVGGSETDLGTDSFGAVRPNDNACP